MFRLKLNWDPWLKPMVRTSSGDLEEISSASFNEGLLIDGLDSEAWRFMYRPK